MAPVIELQFWGKWAGDTWGPYAKHSMAINCSGLSCFLHCLSQIAFDSKPNYTQGVRTRSYLNTPAYTLSPDLARLTYVCMYGWINNEKHILHMESERYTFKLFSVCNCQSRLYSRTKLVWYFAGYLLDVEALWRSFWSGHLNQCQYSGLKVVKRLTNDCSSGNFLIGMVVIQLNLTDNPEI